jgi:Predicted membrane-associated, metal-dependent hydrolase
MPLLLQRMQRFALGHRAVAHSPQASRAMHPAWVVVLASAWLATACNVPLWREVAALPGQGTLRGWGFALAFAVIVAAGNAALLSVLAWRWTLKPAITVMLLLAAFGAYFMLAYGIAIDASMLVNVMQTDVKEAGDLLNWRMVSTVLALTAPPLLWLYRRPVRQMPAFGTWPTTACCWWALSLSSWSACCWCSRISPSTMRNHTRLRYLINPLNSVYALGNIATKPLRLDTNTLMPLGRDAQLGASYAGQQKPPLLGAGAGRNRAQREFRAQRLRPAHHAPAVGPHRPCFGAQRLVVRHQHGRIGALHVFAPGARRLRIAQGQLRKPDRRAAPRGPGRAVGGQPGWLQGLCANASAKCAPRHCKTRCCVLAESASTPSCSRTWTSAWPTCPPNSAAAAPWSCCTRWAATAPPTSNARPRP